MQCWGGGGGGWGGFHSSVVPEECRPGMLLSYHKGVEMAENNVFVFLSRVVVTQLYARKSSAPFTLDAQVSNQVSAIDRIACNSHTPVLYWKSARKVISKRSSGSGNGIASRLYSIKENTTITIM